MSRGKILITGGTGYVASHTLVELIEAGYKPVLIDNYSNSESDVVNRVEKIAGCPDGSITVFEGNVCEHDQLSRAFSEHDILAVMHFAGFKAVGESVEKSLMYYQNNLGATMNVIRVMNEFGCKKIVFSSSATVYGTNNEAPFIETMPTSCSNPYGWTKLMSEQILSDSAFSDPEFTPVLLRYFNPVGAHSSGLIGENPRGIPNNLMPFVQQVASGKLKKLTIFGDDYNTPDGTGVRDFIHIVDLAKGHVAALDYALENNGVEIFNLGTGKGTSVIELVEAFKCANSVDVPYVIGPRRAGDIASCFADVSKAEKILGWKARLEVEEMCQAAWNWEKNNKE